MAGVGSRSQAESAPKPLSSHFGLVTRCGDFNCRRDLFLLSNGKASRHLAVSYFQPVVSEDGLRCLVYGQVDKDLASGNKERDGIWLMDASGSAKRVRGPGDAILAQTSFLRQPSHGYLLYAPAPAFDPRGWLHAVTTEGEDTLWALVGASKAERVAAFGSPGDLDELSKSGAALDTPNPLGMTPLEMAIASGNEAVASRLCSLGVARGPTAQRALEWSVSLGRLETLRAMVAGGADLRPADSTRSLLHIAVASRAGWPIEPPDPRHELREFTVAFADRVTPETYVACVATLLELGCDVHAVNEWGGTALHELAAAYVPALSSRADRTLEGKLRSEVARLLLDRGADPNARDSRGSTALHQLVFPEAPEIAEPMIHLLAGRGADVNAVNARGETPLQHLFYFYGDSARARFGSVDRPSQKTFQVAAALVAHGARAEVPEGYRRKIERLASHAHGKQ